MAGKQDTGSEFQSMAVRGKKLDEYRFSKPWVPLGNLGYPVTMQNEYIYIYFPTCQSDFSFIPKTLGIPYKMQSPYEKWLWCDRGKFNMYFNLDSIKHIIS